MEKEPTISQNFSYMGGWKTLSLTESEIEVLKELHGRHTVETLKQCIDDVKEVIPQTVDISHAVCALFEARVEKFFTWVQRALQDKTRNARANGGVAVEEERVKSSPSSGGD